MWRPTIQLFKLLLLLIYLLPAQAQLALAEQERSIFMVELEQLNSGDKLDDFFYYYEDKSAAQELTQVLTLADNTWLQNSQSDLSFGFTDSAYWFRLHLNNPTEKQQQRILELAYPVLDYIDIYQRTDNGDWQLTQLGDKYPFVDRVLQHRLFLVPIEVFSQNSLELMIRVKSSSSMQFPAVIWQVDDFYAHDQNNSLVMGIYYGIMLVMVLYNFFFYFVVREKDYLYYVFFVGFLTLFVASLHGFNFQYLWPNATSWNDTSIVVFLATAMLFGMLFTFNFLQLNSIYILRQARNAVSAFLLLFIVSTFFISYHYTIRILIVVAVFTVTIAMVLAITSWMRGHTAARYYMLAWTTMLAGGAVLAMNKFNIIPRNFFTENVMQIGFVIEVILLSLALADRLNQEKRQRLDAQVKALENERLARQSQYEALKHERKANEAQAAALEIQKQATETLEARVKERTEELEKVNEQLEMMSITDSLTNIRNRRYFDRTLKLEMARAIRQKQSISVLIIDIDYFKGVNDSYGHQAGDEVLKGIANSLSKTINRSTDLLARFGGEEFVVILPDTTPEGAVHVADCILKEIAQLRFDEISAGLKITASIGIYGDVPTHGSSHDTWVCNADDALYYAKNNGRNQVVSFAQISAAKAQIE